MFKIAICGDEQNICTELESVILNYSKNVNYNIEVIVFNNSLKLCEYLTSGEYLDLIFLDIEMEDLDGIQVGIKIRQEFDNQLVHIVFLSWKENYCPQLFAIRPTNFLQKPIRTVQITEEICRVKKLTGELNKVFVFKKGWETIKLPIKNILYFEALNKMLRIVTTNDEFTYYDNIKNINEEIKSFKFIQIHRSYIVNYFHINKFKYDEVELTNGERLTISQSRRKGFRALRTELEFEDNKGLF